MKPELFIARKLALGKDGVVPLGVKIGIFGVALAFTIMLISISVVTGFKNDIKAKLNGFEADVALVSENEEMPINYNKAIVEDIAEAFGTNISVDSIISLQAVLKTDSAFHGLVIRCVSPASSVMKFITETLDNSEFPDSVWQSPNSILISSYTANKLNVTKGDKIFAHFFNKGDLKTRRLDVVGVFNTHFEEYDNVMAFAPLSLGHSVSGLSSGQFTDIEINGVDSKNLDDKARDYERLMVSRRIQEGNRINELPRVSTISQRGALYFNWLDLLDTNVAVIITLMTIVASFTLVSSLFILILQRVSTIGLLKSIGATDRKISNLFMLLGQKIILRGLLWGNIIGGSFIVIQHITHFIPLDPESYFLGYVPTDINIFVWIMLNLWAIIIGWLVLMIPAYSISRMSVVSALTFRKLSD